MNLPGDLLSDSFLDSLPLLGLYAETHFRFRIPFSRYFQKEPELIFDTPWRLEPGETPTLFLVIKDAHRYPIQIDSVEIVANQNEQEIFRQTWKLKQTIHEQQTQLEFKLAACQPTAGELTISPYLNYTINGKNRQLHVDNYLQLAKPPLRITVAQDPLPKFSGWLAGDMHLHTALTDDQVEFGASLHQTRRGAQLFGLDFITATDHSYDLDDLPGDYLQNDPELVKWTSSRHAIEEMNKEGVVSIIPAEEISVANARGANVHLLHYNDSHYFPGSGDGAEDWLNLKAELSIGDVLSQRSHNTASVAAHSLYKVPWLQQVLLNRGFWDESDHENQDLNGIQILNGTPASEAFQESRQAWINTLLKGYRLAAYGGSDAHGNFNRNWHIKLPMWSLGIQDEQIFGQARTLLRSASNDPGALIQAMQAGRSALTTGPTGDLTLECGHDQVGIGDSLSMAVDQELTVTMRGFSTTEFGSKMDVTLYWGNLQRAEETILYHETDQEAQFEIKIPITPDGNGYLRLEITSEGNRWPGLYLSSPIWVDIT